MFNSISWQEFLAAIAVVVIGYYVITTLLLYSGEITYIFKQKESKLIDSATQDDQSGSNERNDPSDLMGKIKYETEVNVPREKSVASEELQFQSSNESEEVIVPVQSNQTDTLLIGTIADLLQEIKALAEVVSISSKEESVSFFKSLLQRFSKLRGTHYEDAVNVFIYNSCKEQCSFDLQPNEIKSWWIVEEENLKHNQ
jgi:hypothetical protein